MSGREEIDKIALDFITVYKRLKDKRLKSRMIGRRKDSLKNEGGERGRLDKITFY